MLDSDLARPDAFGSDPGCPGCYDTTQSDVDPTGAVGNTRRARDAAEREAGRVGLSMRRATDEARGYYYPRLYGCRGVSCFGLHAGAFATELFAGVAPQSRDDVLLDATLTLSTGGLAKAGRSADDLRALARQFHRDESGAIKLEEFARAKERFRQRTIGRLLAARARKAAGFADEGVRVTGASMLGASRRSSETNHFAERPTAI